MSVYALDSNIISFYLKGNSAVIKNIEKAINEEHSIVITPIGEMGNYILEEAIKVYVQERKAKRNTEDADILIAAFCLQNNSILVTDNVKHFQGIVGLHLVIWAAIT